MIPHEPRLRAAVVSVPTLSSIVLACGLAACGRVPGQFEIINNQVPTGGCAIPVSDTIYRGQGVLDARLVQSGAQSAYYFFPLLKNNLPGAAAGDVDQNQISLTSFAVDISALSAPDSINAVLADPSVPALLHYKTPWSGTLASGGGELSAFVAAFPVDLAARMLASQGLSSSSSVLMNLRIRSFGHTNTRDIESDPFDYPLRVCAGCLIAQSSTCPFTVAATNPGNPCNVAQDEPVDCCSAGNDSDLSAAGSGLAVTTTPASALQTSLLTLLVASAFGCTGASNMNSFPPPNPGGGPGHMPSGTVSVAIEAPTDGLPPFGPGSLIDVRAHISVQGGTDFIDGTTVQVVVTKAGSTVETGMLVFSSGDLYAGRVSLGGDLTSGSYTLTVNAMSSGGATGTASVSFELDGGPTIIVTSPVEGQSYKRMLTVEVVATDAFGLPGPPTATIGPVDVPLSDAGVPDTFRGMIDFDAQDPPMFGPQLLTVAVTNVHGYRTEAKVIFIVDNEGPAITLTHPTPGQIVGGIVEISATIEDNAGVLDASVIAVIGDQTGTPVFQLPLRPTGTGTYSTLFDSGRLTQCQDPQPASNPTCIVFPTISFRASDLVDNESVVSYDFAVDNIAPLADLDPPNLRDTKLDKVFRCSWSFDPLGNDDNIGDMPNDNTYVPQVFDLRARIEDQGNGPAPGTKLTPKSLVDPGKTDVYILKDVTQPLVVDTDGNGTCDSINPLLIPTTLPPTMNNQVLKIRLGAVPPAGSADFTADPSIPSTQTTPCAQGLDPERPKPICTFLQPTVAISYAFGQPALWSVEPIDQLHCQGNQFDTKANNFQNGWLCIAVGTGDNAGNFGVSRPLRVFVDQSVNFSGRGFGVSAAPEGPAPNCTGVYDRNTNMIVPGTCTTEKYPANQFCYLGGC